MSEKPAQTGLSREHEAYLTERKEFLQSRLEFSKSYDTWLLTLAGGALALSLTFLEKISGPANPTCSWLLAGGWLLLVSTVLLLMYCLWMTVEVHGKFVEILDSEAATGDDRFWTRVRELQSKEKYVRRIRICNLIALATFVAGIMLLLSFSFFNLERIVAHG